MIKKYCILFEDPTFDNNKLVSQEIDCFLKNN